MFKYPKSHINTFLPSEQKKDLSREESFFINITGHGKHSDRCAI